VGGKRVYYLIYEELKAVLMIAVSDKKAQQQTIDEIKMHLKDYYTIIREAIRQHGGFDHV
jgi:ribosome-binding protein aMBF1 (putative translation factor)